VVVKGLDDALPERRAKRGRDGEKNAGRAAKRQTPDRRTEAAPAKPATAKVASVPAKKATGKVTDDPVEKAKAEARAKRFQTTT
jgi:SAP domain-containing ribonucleoprotein